MTTLIFTLNAKSIRIDCPTVIENPAFFTKNENLRNLIFFIDEYAKTKKDQMIVELFKLFFCSYSEQSKSPISRLYARPFMEYLGTYNLLSLALSDVLSFLNTSLDRPSKEHVSEIMSIFLENTRFSIMTSPTPAPLERIDRLPIPEGDVVDTRKIVSTLIRHPLIRGFGRDLVEAQLQSQVCITEQAIEFIVNEFLKFVSSYKQHTQRVQQHTPPTANLFRPFGSVIPSAPALRSRPVPDGYPSQFEPVTHLRSSGRGYSEGIDYRRYAGYCRYFHASHGGFAGLVNQAGRAFIVFTKENEPNKYFIMLKSNTHIPPESEDDRYTYHPLYSRGGQKQIKLYSLLLTFNENLSNGQIELSSIHKTVTFSKPTENIVGALKDIPPAKYRDALQDYSKLQTVGALTKFKKEELKANAMRMLFTFPSLSSEFLFWDIISFKDVVPMASSDRSTAHLASPVMPERIVAYQKYSGTQFLTALGTPMQLETKHYFIMSFLADIKRIICSKNRIPYDIKPENICYEPRLSNPLFWKAKVIDFITGGVSVTFLNWQDNLERSTNYHHPITIINNLDKITLDDARAKLNQRMLQKFGNINDTRDFQLIIYHFCFEVAVTLFCIMNQEISEDVIDILSIQATEFLSTPHAFRETLKTILGKSPRSLMFYQLLEMYTYRQNFDLAVSEIITNFFTAIRLEILQMQTMAPLIGLPDKSHFVSLSEAGNRSLSDQWIQEMSDAVTNMLTSPKPETLPIVVELKNI